MNIIIFDIDGVLADCDHRLMHILAKKPADWDTFDKLTSFDLPIKNMHRLLKLAAINPFIEIILLTGRADRNDVRKDTRAWLRNHDLEFNKLVMRTDGDHSPAHIMKLRKLEQLNIQPHEVITVFEDHPKTIQALRDSGYHVCDVGGWRDNYTEILTEGGPE